MTATIEVDRVSYSPSAMLNNPQLKQKYPELIEALGDWIEEKPLEISTSGSTGTPKVIRHSRESIEISINATVDHFKLKKNARALCALPIDKIAGRMMLYRALYEGWRLTYRKPSSVPLVKGDAFDFVALTPHQTLQCLESDSTLFDEVELLIIGGATVDPFLQKKLIEAKIKSYETYGMTETLTHIATRMIYPSTEGAFTALPGVHFSHYEGNLIIHSNRSQSEVQTTDVVTLEGETVFKWHGRSDFVINSGGVKLHPEELEQKVGSCISFPFFFGGKPDSMLGQKLICWIEAEEKDIDVVQMNACFAKQLSKLERPKEIRCISTFERTSTGKIKRNAFA